jgi:glucose/arabinose dehydrogenase
MLFPRRFRNLCSVIAVLGAWCESSSASPAKNPPAEARSEAAECREDDSGLKLPPGFCATVFADGIGHARHLAVAPNGVVYVNT